MGSVLNHSLRMPIDDDGGCLRPLLRGQILASKRQAVICQKLLLLLGMLLLVWNAAALLKLDKI